MSRCACACACSERASAAACAAVAALVLAYCALGAVLFAALEGRPPSAAQGASAPALAPAPAPDELRRRTVERLWAITEDLNILYKENWTELAARELVDFQRVLLHSARGASAEARPGRDSDFRWTFSGSFLYALTLITTIGHGNVAPKSSAGKLAAIAYACVGIPLVMLYLSTLGDALARQLRAAYARFRPRGPPPDEGGPPPGAAKRTPFQLALNAEPAGPGHGHGHGHGRRCRGRARARVPGAAAALLLALYVALGALGFGASERWSLLDGCFFSFSSLATIGLGAARPGRHAGSAAACCAYILVGVAVAAAAFNLLRDAARAELRALAALCAGGGRAVHEAPLLEAPAPEAPAPAEPPPAS